MKRILRLLLAAAFLAGLAMLPFHAGEAADLLPVKTVIITKSGREYVVDVGAGVKAAGKTLAEALERLREEVTGKIFFGTADQVVVTDAAADVLEELTESQALRPAAGLYRTPAEDLDAKAVGDYLTAHSSNTTILQVKARMMTGQPMRIPVLVPAEGGFRVYE